MFDWITNMIDAAGLFGVAALMFLENLFPPIPSELIMPLAGFLAADGRLSVTGVVIAGIIGTMLGAIFWYETGRLMGRERLLRLVDRHGIWLTLTRAEAEGVFRWFDRHGPEAVFIARLFPGPRTFISVPAGIAEMPRGKFYAYTLAGTAIWTGFLTAAGFVLQSNYEAVQHWLDPVATVIVIAVVGLYLFRLVRMWRRQRA